MSPIHRSAIVTAIAHTVFAGAIFGFFYAWVCSTMWGLDEADPRVAIDAMNAMNGSVRNMTFLPAFFLTPVVGLAAAVLAWLARARTAAVLLAVAALLYAVGGIWFTQTYNVPLNEGLMATATPENIDEAAAVWRAYSSQWQVLNIARTVVSGICLALVATGVAVLARHRDASPAAEAGLNQGAAVAS